MNGGFIAPEGGLRQYLLNHHKISIYTLFLYLSIILSLLLYKAPKTMDEERGYFDVWMRKLL